MRLLRPVAPALLLLGLSFFTACRALPEDPPATVESVDLNRYTGLWHELARLPVFFQKDNERATAEYVMNDAGNIDLVNTAIAPDGSQRSVTGTAVPVAGSNNAKLKVSIDNFFAQIFGSPPDYGNYWILKLESDYSIALVGSPNRKTLWLLAKTPEIPASKLQAYIAYAETLGYEVSELIINNGH
ncbi:lipocalin family protein [Coraliomargarita algicola]|uniref:Lipocalin family protein n=3 Tax=Coraliomargaritaceae TaxID=3056371 RepID=A0ABU1AZD1_9BACT|nr:MULTISPECIES: lipocalin family protein [unclassified Coraliomargarita]MDQ8195899.1 lipocalin family protein [Coraliomargarita sp. SDUM461004]MDQ8209504.1 lipocalin family protein [Coraliomargarita sp. SDUM461003]WPJ95430.1 lipocalin family protein [Coraliomargarita sp. J2-16]